METEIAAGDITVEKVRTTKAVERHERLEALNICQRKIDTIFSHWKTEADEVRNARKPVAYWLLGAMISQGILADVAFFLLGLGYLQVDEWTARIFIMSVFAELAAMVFFIVKYLFSRTDRDLLNLIEKI